MPHLGDVFPGMVNINSTETFTHIAIGKKDIITCVSLLFL